MGLFKTMKTNAKRMMSGAWGRAIGVMLLVLLPAVLINMLEQGMRGVAGVPAFMDYAGTAGVALDDTANVAALSVLVSILMGIFMFIVVAPLQLGAARWYYRRTNGANEGVSELFHYFETSRDYFRALGVTFSIGVRMLFWGVLLCLPLVGIGAVYSIAKTSSGGVSGGVALVSAFLLLIWVVLSCIIIELIVLRYFLAPYLLAEHPEMKAQQAIKQSVKLTRGHKGSLLLFELSFILWFIPLLLVVMMIAPAATVGSLAVYSVWGSVMLALVVQFGLAFYLQPYMSASFAMYARYLIQIGENDGGDATREYTACKTEIDRYMEEQAANPTRETPIPPEVSEADTGPEGPEMPAPRDKNAQG